MKKLSPTSFSLSSFRAKRKKEILITSCVFLACMGTLSLCMGSHSFKMNKTYNISLADEKVPFDKKHDFNVAKLERELAVNMLNEAQMMMIYKRLPLYQPMINEKLKKAWLPTDLFYLVLAESALRETAVSSAGAAGLWQFMPATAKSHGLRVDEQIDERYHVEKATFAAIDYLQKAHKTLKNRTLSMAAYNRGTAGILRDMERQYQNNYYDLHLNNETQRYIFRIIAMKEIFENIDQYFDTSKWGLQYFPAKTKEVTLGKTENLAARAVQNGNSYLEIRTLNPRIRKNSLPEGIRNIKLYQD